MAQSSTGDKQSDTPCGSLARIIFRQSAPMGGIPHLGCAVFLPNTSTHSCRVQQRKLPSTLGEPSSTKKIDRVAAQKLRRGQLAWTYSITGILSNILKCSEDFLAKFALMNSTWPHGTPKTLAPCFANGGSWSLLHTTASAISVGLPLSTCPPWMACILMHSTTSCCLVGC